MKIVKAEAQKLFTDKAVTVLILLSLAVNIAVIMSGGSYSSEVKYINNVISHTGTKVTEASINSAESILKKDYETLENKFANLFGYYPDSINDIYKYMPDSAELCQNYTALNNMIETAQIQLENAENSEKEIYFSADCITLANEMLYSKLLFCIYAGLAVIGVFTVFKSVGCEFGTGTHLCLYSNKIGRKLQKTKLTSCLIFISVVYIFMCLLCLTVFYTLYPQSSFLSGSLRAVNMTAAASKYSFTALSYLLSHIGVGYTVVVIYLLTAYSIGLLIKNQYMSITVFTVSQAVFFAGTAGNSDFNRLFSYTPVTLLISLNNNISVNTEKWLLHSDTVFSSESFVIRVLFIWLIIGIMGASAANTVFKRRDI